MGIIDVIAAGIIHHFRSAGIPALTADPVVGAVGPLGGVTAACEQPERSIAGIFPEGIIKTVVGSRLV